MPDVCGILEKFVASVISLHFCNERSASKVNGCFWGFLRLEVFYLCLVKVPFLKIPCVIF